MCWYNNHDIGCKLRGDNRLDFGNNTTSMKEESTIITGKHINANPICQKRIKTIFILPISIVKMGKNLQTAGHKGDRLAARDLVKTRP